MQEGLKTDGSDKHRERDVPSEDRGAGRSLSDVAEHSRPKSQPRERGAILGERALVACTAREEGVGGGIQSVLRETLDLGEADRLGGRQSGRDHSSFPAARSPAATQRVAAEELADDRRTLAGPLDDDIPRVSPGDGRHLERRQPLAHQLQRRVVALSEIGSVPALTAAQDEDRGRDRREIVADIGVQATEADERLDRLRVRGLLDVRCLPVMEPRRIGDAEAAGEHAGADTGRAELLDDRPVDDPDPVVCHLRVARPDVVVGHDRTDETWMPCGEPQGVVAREPARPKVDARDADLAEDVSEVIREDVEVVAVQAGVGTVGRPHPARLPSQQLKAGKMRPDEIELEMPRRPAAEQEEGLAVAAGVVEPELYRSRIDETTCAERQSPRPPVSSRQADPASHSPRVISFGVLNDEHGNGRALDQVLRPVDRHEEVPSIRCHALAPVCLVRGSNSNPAVATRRRRVLASPPR